MTTTLSIAMPSNRDFGKSLKAIDSADIYCSLSPHIDLAVSDNSGCPNKDAVFRTKKFFHLSEPCGMTDNVCRAFSATKGEYVLIMGDDDRIFSVNTASNLNIDSKEIAGIHPSVAAFTPKKGIIKGDALDLNANTAKGRIEQFADNCNSSNLAFFSFWRRDIIKSLLDLWFNHHPTKGNYCDWSVMNALASSGKVIHDPSTVYFYNLTNWYGNADFIRTQTEKAFTDSGLPKEASQYREQFQAIDSFIFINRKDSPVADEAERLEAALLCLGNLKWNEALELAEHFGLKEKYQQFYLHATGKEWGCI